MPTHQASQRLSFHRTGSSLRQCLGHYLIPKDLDPLSGCIQTLILPSRCQDSLSLLCLSHVHVHIKGPRLRPNIHQPTVPDGIYDIHSSKNIILQRGRLYAYDPTDLVSTTLIILPSTDPTQQPIHIFTKPGTVHLTERHKFSKLLTKPPSTPPPPPPSASPSRFPTKKPSNTPSQGLQ